LDVRVAPLRFIHELRQLAKYRDYTHDRLNECNRLIYIRACQEHFSPSAGGAGLFRDIQSLSPWKTLVWCPAVGYSISSAASSLVATTPISFETNQAVRLYGVNHGSI
jgi:hypothetical protein